MSASQAVRKNTGEEGINVRLSEMSRKHEQVDSDEYDRPSRTMDDVRSDMLAEQAASTSRTTYTQTRPDFDENPLMPPRITQPPATASTSAPRPERPVAPPNKRPAQPKPSTSSAPPSPAVDAGTSIAGFMPSTSITSPNYNESGGFFYGVNPDGSINRRSRVKVGGPTHERLARLVSAKKAGGQDVKGYAWLPAYRGRE